MRDTMKNTVLLLTVLFSLATLSLPAQTIVKIPRRVYFAQAPSPAGLTREVKSLTDGIGEFLYTAVSALKPIVRADDRVKAHSVVAVAVSRSQDRGVFISVTLQDGNTTRVSADYQLESESPDLKKFSRFINDTAQAFAPFLDMISPEARPAASEEREKNLVEIVQEVEYADQLAKSFDMTLWFTGAMRLFHSSNLDDPGMMSGRKFNMLPIIFDATWYFHRNIGAFFSIWFDYSDDFAFGLRTEPDPMGGGDITLGKARSNNLFLLPGIGLSYRTLDTISAQFTLGFYAGAVRVEAIENVTGVADAGQAAWIFYALISINSVIVFNVTPSFALKAKIAGINFNPMNLSGGENAVPPMDYNGVFIQFFSLGASYRL